MKNINKLTLLPIMMLFVLSISFFIASPASAANFTVATGNDETTTNASCSLSEAIHNINDQAATYPDCPAGNGTNDTINLPAGTITLTADLPEISESIIIQGASETTSIIEGSSFNAGFGVQNSAIIDKIEAHDFTVNGGSFSGVSTNGADVGTLIATDLTLTGAGGNAGGNLVVVAENAENVTIQNITISRSSGTCRVAAVNNANYLTATVSNISISQCEESYVQFAAESTTQASELTAQDITIRDSGRCFLYSELNNNSGDLSFTLERVRITGCPAAQAAVQDQANTATNSFTFRDIVLQDNHNASGNDPGVMLQLFITSQGEVVVENITIADNSIDVTNNDATIAGYFILPPTALVRNITLADNTASSTGTGNQSIAGLAIVQFGTGSPLPVSHLSVSNNHATNPDAPDDTFAGYFSATVDGSFSQVDNIATLSNSLLSNNTSNGADSNCRPYMEGVFGSTASTYPISAGGNISDDSTCATFTHSADQTNVSTASLDLQPLGNNGGFVPTIALGPDSIALDRGLTLSSITTDARGIARPQACAYDIGAYEQEQSSCTTPTTPNTPSSSSTGSTPAQPPAALANTGASSTTFLTAALTLIISSLSLLSFRRFSTKA